LRKYFFGDDTMINFDGEEHRFRKKAVLQHFTPECLQKYMDFYGNLLDKYMATWTQKDQIKIEEEMRWLQCEFAMGVFLGIYDPPLHDLKKRSKQINYIIETFGSIPLPVEIPGTRISKAGKARRSMNEWIMKLILQTKEAQLNGAPKQDNYLSQMVDATDLEGNPISEEVFAAELINMLRPTTLASYFHVFLMHAFHENPVIFDNVQAEVLQHLKETPDLKTRYYADTNFLAKLQYGEYCAKEIRRYYPCIPLLVARTKEAFEYKGYYFPKEYLLILGIHAIHRDPRVWSNPDTFDPLRFERKEHQKCDERFAVVQQGGGDLIENHKCAGETLATLMIKAFAARMTNDFKWKFAEKQDFSYSLKVMPTLPKDGIIIEGFEHQHKELQS